MSERSTEEEDSTLELTEAEPAKTALCSDSKISQTSGISKHLRFNLLPKELLLMWLMKVMEK